MRIRPSRAASTILTRWQGWLLTTGRVAVHEATRSAVLADLHLGYEEARQRAGEAIPLRPLVEQLRPLLTVCTEHACRTVIVVGDLFEAGWQNELAEEVVSLLQSNGIEHFALVPGNHDRGYAPSPHIFPQGIELADWLLVHGEGELPDRCTVIGHWHPAILLGRRKVPCYLLSPRQIVLPAYTTNAAGVDYRQESRWREYVAVPIV